MSHPSEAVIFETVRTDGLAHLSYLVGERSTGRAAVIDPRRDVEVYLELAREHRLAITHAVETHIHADFISAYVNFTDGIRRPVFEQLDGR
jgi:hydroxyacylglutathione hydrolase